LFVILELIDEGTIPLVECVPETLVVRLNLLLQLVFQGSKRVGALLHHLAMLLNTLLPRFLTLVVVDYAWRMRVFLNELGRARSVLTASPLLV
jgi:hypothetical protein